MPSGGLSIKGRVDGWADPDQGPGQAGMDRAEGARRLGVGVGGGGGGGVGGGNTPDQWPPQSGQPL